MHLNLKPFYGETTTALRIVLSYHKHFLVERVSITRFLAWGVFFFMNRPHMEPWFIPLIFFEFDFELSEMFIFESCFPGSHNPRNKKNEARDSISMGPWVMPRFHMLTNFKKCPFKRTGRLPQLSKWSCGVMKRPVGSDTPANKFPQNKFPLGVRLPQTNFCMVSWSVGAPTIGGFLLYKSLLL